MKLFDFLSEQFPDGIPYEDAVDICLGIYSSNNILPSEVQKDDLTMVGIADVFARLAQAGLIKNYSSYKAVLYGANYHSIEDKGHWIEIQASILKLKVTYNVDKSHTLLAKKN